MSSILLFHHGIQNSEDLEKFKEKVLHDPPKLIINNAVDKRQDENTKMFLSFIRHHYDIIAHVEHFQVFRRKYE